MAGPSSSATSTTTINDLPDVILSNIIAAVSDTRSRNSTALACRKWRLLERYTRTSLTLRGMFRDLFLVPTCFRSITHLDISHLSPWGHSLLLSSSANPFLLAQHLRNSFPSLTSLTLYARNPDTLQLLAPQWPQLTQIKLVRWHQRPQQLPTGADLAPIFEHCAQIASLDLSSFYCWTDDVVLDPNLAAKLTRLDLLNPSFAEGFKSPEIKAITSVCPNLKDLRAACMFDPRYLGFISDGDFISIAKNCPNLSILHLADTSTLSTARSNLNNEGFTSEDAKISVPTLLEFFSGLPWLEDLVLDVGLNVRDSGPAFEMLNSKCPNLRSLKIGQFHGICIAIESKLDGISLCQKLESLSIKNSADLTDMGLIAIARGCSRLTKLEVEGCKKITVRGMRTLACLLCKTLIDVKISNCRNLGAASSLKALEPIQDRIQRLHFDCVWDSVEQCDEFNFDLNKDSKRLKYSYDHPKSWIKLEYLSLWIAVGELLTPLTMAGLEFCPNLAEIRIKVEGDCREWSRPSAGEFGLSSLMCYPNLKKMHLDCGDIIGYAHTAPSGQMDLSLWERFYLFGIGSLRRLTELEYWPPQDRDVNNRSLTLPAAGLLAGCSALRKLFIHGTAHEHFMMFLLRIPNLRDVQLREDYYPAPENDMSTEMRVDSCCRFEDALNSRQILD